MRWIRSLRYVFVVVFMAAGTLGIVRGVMDGMRSRASNDWPTVTGRVLESEVQRLHSRSRPSRQQGTVFRPTVRYAYEVDGKQYTAKRIAFVMLRVTRSDARQRVAPYPVGGTITVYHHPRRHGVAVLEPGVHREEWQLPTLGAVFLTCAWMMLAAIVYQNRKHQPGDAVKPAPV